MLLSFNQLQQLVEKDIITPVEFDQINAASIDVRLGDTILTEAYSDHTSCTLSLVDRTPMAMMSVNIKDGYYDLQPGEFILAHTMERFNLPDWIAAEFKLKSSGARSGLNNALATWCDPGWHGSVLTLELQNLTRNHVIRLHHGVRIGQIIFHMCEPVPEDRSYSARGRYNNDASVQAVKL